MASSSCFVDTGEPPLHLHNSHPSERAPRHLQNHPLSINEAAQSFPFETYVHPPSSAFIPSQLNGGTPRKMTSWAHSYRVDMDRDSTFCWQGTEDNPGDDTNDFFGQFVDFEGDGSFFPSSTMAGSGDAISADVPRLADTLLLDHPPESTGSSTTAEEFDFLSSSSHIGPGSAAGHDIDPSALTANHVQQMFAVHQHFDYPGRGSISDSELPRLEGMTLISPTKPKHVTSSQPSSPTPPNTMPRKTTNTFFENAKSTIKKVARRKPKKAAQTERPGSPAGDVPAPLNISRQRPRKTAGASKKASVSPPAHDAHQGNFIQGACDDPFTDVPPVPQHLRCYANAGHEVSPPMISPGVKSEPGSYHGVEYAAHSGASWAQQANSMPQTSVQWNGMPSSVGPGESGVWDYNQGQFVNQKHIDVNQAVYTQHGELPYEYQHHMPDTATSGLMIQMPQPRQPQPTVVNDLTHNAQTHLPPPPPPPQPVSEKPHRPPRAPSSGARHLSHSPVRRNRAPSASPTRTTPTAAQKRHSSGGSVSSARSASGRLPASMPGTPCSVRKRKSRDPSNGGMGGGSGSGEVGFVNFTPHDGSMLMTGVAPSGSSKTKARREKEAVDRRRKLSEAALKAVAAAGGDVEALMQQGFTF